MSLSETEQYAPLLLPFTAWVKSGAILLMQVSYSFLPAKEVTEAQLQACSKLFSDHYGVWGPNPDGRKVGSRVRMSGRAWQIFVKLLWLFLKNLYNFSAAIFSKPEQPFLPAMLPSGCLVVTKLREQLLFDDDTCFLVTATLHNELVGHAFGCQFWYPSGQSRHRVTWITQLVVSSVHRGKGIGSQLCCHSWATGSDFACGLVTSHPYAVRALERATGRLCCSRTIVMEHGKALVRESGIPYVQGCEVILPESGGCLINTVFFVDHTDVNQLITQQHDWELGSLPDGHEFFAFTFGFY